MGSLLELPLEIRLSIYHYLYSDNKPGLTLGVEECEVKTYCRPLYGAAYRLSENSWHKNILLSCRQCYNEAVKMHHASLTYLSVEVDKVQKAPLGSRLEFQGKHRPQSNIYNALNDLYRSSHHRTLLRQIRHLTLPSSLPCHAVMDYLQLTLLPNVKVLEFVATNGQVRDVAIPYEKPPFSKGPLPAPDCQHIRGYAPKEYLTYSFDPRHHILRSGCCWIYHDDLPRDPDITLREPLPEFTFLWTSQVDWVLCCTENSLKEAQVPIDMGQTFGQAACHSVRYVSTPCNFENSSHIVDSID